MSEIEYLAIPYSDPDPKVMDYRAELSDIVCADLMNQGRVIFAPISSCHHIAKKYTLPRDWEFWKNIDEQLKHKLFLEDSNGRDIFEMLGMKYDNSMSEPELQAGQKGIKYMSLNVSDILMKVLNIKYYR